PRHPGGERRRVGRGSGNLRTLAAGARLPLLLTAAVLLSAVIAAAGPDAKEDVARSIEAKRAAWSDTALEIWRCAEVGFQEKKSSARLQSELRAAAFEV